MPVARPRLSVLISGPMCIMVSKTDSAGRMSAPGELKYREIFLVGSSFSWYRSMAISCSKGQVENIVRNEIGGAGNSVHSEGGNATSEQC